MIFVSRWLDNSRGDGTKARAIRGSGFTVLHIIGSNGLKLASNLVLTRLLFPEAFGLMALTQIFIYGLATFSDLGINTSIIQSKRGDDQRFLDVAWTIQIGRGILLWIASLLLAIPAAGIYDEPMLKLLLPAVALSVLIEGFKTTREAQLARHMKLEKATILALISQAIGIVLMAILAFAMESVWALAIGTVAMSAIQVLILNFFLPGPKNKLCWDWEIFHEIFKFGQYIFLSTICSFFIHISDRAVLGAFIDTSLLGIYSIALMIGALPGQTSHSIARKILFPLYRIKPPSESSENQKNVFRARRLVSAPAILGLGLLALISIWAIDFLYDSRYALAGPMVALIALRAIPSNAVTETQNVLLANGDSRTYFFFMLINAMLQFLLTWLGVINFGIVGAIFAPAVTILATYPLRVFLTAKYSAWDPLGDAAFMLLGFTLTGLACAIHWERISSLLVL